MINKKGLPCKKCNGTGKINNQFFKNLQKILSNEVSKCCTSQYQKLLIEHLEKKKADQAAVVHPKLVDISDEIYHSISTRRYCSKAWEEIWSFLKS
jgi:hypothetical protein